MRSTQISRESRKTVPFGRLGWDKKSHERWSHGSPSNGHLPNGWKFISTEAWSPSWNTCEKEKDAPDFYLHLLPAPDAQDGGQVRFGAILVVALAASTAEARRAELRKAKSAVIELLQSPLAVLKRRAWGISSGSNGSFRDSVQDFGVGRGLFKRNDPHDGPLSLESFSESWMAL